MSKSTKKLYGILKLRLAYRQKPEKAKGEEKENKLFLAFRRKAKIELSLRFGVRTRTRCAH